MAGNATLTIVSNFFFKWGLILKQVDHALISEDKTDYIYDPMSSHVKHDSPYTSNSKVMAKFNFFEKFRNSNKTQIWDKYDSWIYLHQDFPINNL